MNEIEYKNQLIKLQEERDDASCRLAFCLDALSKIQKDAPSRPSVFSADDVRYGYCEEICAARDAYYEAGQLAKKTIEGLEAL